MREGVKEGGEWGSASQAIPDYKLMKYDLVRFYCTELFVFNKPGTLI